MLIKPTCRYCGQPTSFHGQICDDCRGDQSQEAAMESAADDHLAKLVRQQARTNSPD